jgi:DNA invertase Pin-like site-specific DNA recombinase
VAEAVVSRKTAFAYYRTSSSTNVGEDEDPLDRQRLAVESIARHRGYEIVGEYYDAAVSGADSLDARPQFREMLAILLSNGTRTIIVETTSRFVRDQIVQEAGWRLLRGRGIEIVAADAPDHFLQDTPTSNLIRQVLGAVSDFERATLVEKLRGSRDRKSAKLGHRVEGAKRLGSIPPEHIWAAREFRDTGVKYRELPGALAARGILMLAVV